MDAVRARQLLFFFFFLPAVAASAGAACTAHVDAPLAVDDPIATLDCENRVVHVSDVGPTGGPAIYDRATTVGTFRYDRGGRIVRYRETAGDGTTIAQIDRTWEPTGMHRPLARTFAATYRPSPVVFRWTYDDANRAVRTDDDELVGGRWLRTTAGQRHDESGRILLAWAEVDRLGDLAFTYPDANTVLATSARDGLVERITLVAGRFVTRTEHLYRGRVDAIEETTYDAELRPLVRTYGTGPTAETTTVAWEDGRVRSVTFHVPGRIDRRIEADWDGEGRLVEKRHLGPDPTSPWASDTGFAFTWEGSRLARVERRRLASREVLERWDFAYGCPFDAVEQVDEVATPVSAWARELEPVPFGYDVQERWKPVRR